MKQEAYTVSFGSIGNQHRCGLSLYHRECQGRAEGCSDQAWVEPRELPENPNVSGMTLESLPG